MRKQNDRCVYRHRRLDNNSIFYIGMRTIKRAHQVHKRNVHWKRIVDKTIFNVEILSENLTWEGACELEIFLIQEYGRNNLCNMTDGGDGSKGCIPSINTKIKISNYHTGIPKTDSAKLKISLAKSGIYELNNNPNSKKVINTITNEIYNTLKEASIFEEIKYSTFK